MGYIDEIIDKKFINHKQMVLTGAPGTGKTYNTLKYVKKNTSDDKSKFKFVQFHPSYDYSDFVEGLKPVLIDNNEEIIFVRLDGIFKLFCREIVTNNYKEITGIDLNDINKDELNFNDFKSKYKEIESKISTKYYFVIDEINRADLSKVFGELMFGLEESYRGINNTFDTQYMNLKTYKIDKDGLARMLTFDCFKEGFFIPNNLYIIGTMNDIDRSIESFDFALRRRFQWIEIKENDVLEESLKDMFNGAKDEQIQELKERINKMNDVICESGEKFGLSEAFQIGHSYFKNVDIDDLKTLKEVFDRNISSILKEYLRGRNQKEIDDFIETCKKALCD